MQGFQGIEEEGSSPPGPGVHALLIGISAYPHLERPSHPEYTLGLKPLASAALTAYRIREWLTTARLPVQLRTCELLMCPSESEIASEPVLADLARPCTHAEVVKAAATWRRRAMRDRQSIAFFYFAGHGVHRSRSEPVVLLEDFADGTPAILGKAIGTNALKRGMAPATSQPDMARTQLYFFDACRTTSRRLRQLEEKPIGPLWDVAEEDMVDDRLLAVIRTTRAGERAFGVKGGQSIFSLALLKALDGGAGTRVGEDANGDHIWGVSLTSLGLLLQENLEVVNRRMKTRQKCSLEDLQGDAVVQTLDGPPLVDVDVALKPTGAHKDAGLQVLDMYGKPLWDLQAPLKPHPYPGRLTPGSYLARPTPANAAASREWKRRDATPPYSPWKLTVQA